MKKKVIVLMIAFCFLYVGCMPIDSGKSQNTSATYAEPVLSDVEEINIPFAIEREELTGRMLNTMAVCYSDSKVLILSNVNMDRYNEDTTPIIPEIRTDGIYLIELDSKNINFFNVKNKGTIYEAVPYKDGIVYTSYISNEESDGIESILYKWQVVYFDGNNEYLIDSGCSGRGTAPEIALAKGQPIYVCENNDKGSYNVSIRKIEDKNYVTLKDFSNYEFWNVLESNGTSYCFELNDRKNGSSAIFAGNLDGIYIEKELPAICNSYSITDDYLVYSSGKEMEDAQILGISLDEQKEKIIKQTKRWYRMTGTVGNYCLMVDEGFNLYYVNIEDAKVGQVILPERYEERWLSKGISPLSKESYIINADEEKLFKLTLKH